MGTRPRVLITAFQLFGVAIDLTVPPPTTASPQLITARTSCPYTAYSARGASSGDPVRSLQRQSMPEILPELQVYLGIRMPV
jgi:hypothetical protein